MAVGSLIVALTPSYDSIGVAAPILLVAARLLQGLSVGGEYSTSATYLSEVASPGRRGYYSSFQYVTLIAGQLIGARPADRAAAGAHHRADGRRGAGGSRSSSARAGAIVVMWLRRGMDESESFERAARGRGPDPQDAADRGTLRDAAALPQGVPGSSSG